MANSSMLVSNVVSSDRKGEYIIKEGFGKVGYAWQAGKSDGFTRTFNIKTDNRSGTLTGDAYIGFNPHLDNRTGTDKYRIPKIDRMICNWAGREQQNRGCKNSAAATEL